MMYSGFIVMYTYGKTHPDQSVHFEGPFNTIQDARKVYDDLKSLTPAMQNIQIGRIVTNPDNPMFY